MYSVEHLIGVEAGNGDDNAGEDKEILDLASNLKSPNLLQNVMSNSAFQNSTINFYGQSSRM